MEPLRNSENKTRKAKNRNETGRVELELNKLTGEGIIQV